MAADLVDPPNLKWRRDPVGWARERAGIEVISYQREILESVRDHEQTAVQSCHDIGKSFSAAVTCGWWIDVHPPGEAFVVTTAPSDKQVKAILWREINRLHSRLGLAGRTNLSEWYIGKELVAFGRKPADHDPAAFQGIHARWVLLVMDEACGIPKELWDAGSSLVANEGSRVLAIGNPDDPVSEFATNCRKDSGWHVIQIGYERTPNFTDEPISAELKQLLISPQWVASREKKWGRTSPLFTSKCLGEFPRDTEFGVVPLSWAEACRWLELTALGDVEAGIDVGAGQDRTIIRMRRGPKALESFTFINPDPMQTVGHLALKLKEHRVKRAKIDPIGIGWGIMGRLQELSSVQNPTGECVHDAEIIPVNFAEKPTEGLEEKFLNKRAEVWWNVGREKSRLKQWDLENVDDDVINELTMPKFEVMDSRGKVKIEAKKEIKKRLGASPDEADALLLAFVEVSWFGSFGGHQEMDVDLTRGLDPGTIGQGLALHERADLIEGNDREV